MNTPERLILSAGLATASYLGLHALLDNVTINNAEQQAVRDCANALGDPSQPQAVTIEKTCTTDSATSTVIHQQDGQTQLVYTYQSKQQFLAKNMPEAKKRDERFGRPNMAMSAIGAVIMGSLPLFGSRKKRSGLVEPVKA